MSGGIFIQQNFQMSIKVKYMLKMVLQLRFLDIKLFLEEAECLSMF